MSDENNQTQNQNPAADPNAPQIQIQKLYIKDASFEIPDGAKAFQYDWKPDLNVELDTKSEKLDDKDTTDTFEVVLQVKCTVKCENNIAFIVEAHQAAVITISNIPEEQMQHVLGAYCPNLLYPYLREVVSEMVMKGGFPQLTLAPVNFDAQLQTQNEAENKTVH